MAYEKVFCSSCGGDEVVRNGKSTSGIQSYCCRATGCGKTFQREYRYCAYIPGIKTIIVEMAINGNGIRDAARVLRISQNTVINTIKKNL